MDNNSPNIIYLGFADNRVPEFKEARNKEYILFGEDNKFPDHLLYLFNKSSNHGAIVGGKVKYIFGKGFPIVGTKLVDINRNHESLNKVAKKAITDIELFSGFYLQIIWKLGGGMEVSHMPFDKLRRSKDETGWWYKKDWKSFKKDEIFIPDFDPNNKKGAQIFAYKEYRPGCDVYPLPGYMAALNDIETDVEISKYNLSTIKNGMFGGKMVTFFTGDPGEEGKKKIEAGWKSKFNGSENSGKTMFVFCTNGQTAPQVEDLSTTDLDKLFDQLNKTTQAEIFTGHEVTSSTLFGVKTEGGLGDRAEIETAYEVFKNTYVNNKQEAFEEAISFLYPYFGVAVPLKLIPVDPVGFKLSDDKMAEIMPKEWIFEKLGIDPAKYPSIANVSGVTEQGMVNEHLKNLTGKQNQALQRIIRQYNKEKITRDQAAAMLRSSLAMDEDSINIWLGGSNFAAIHTEEDVAEMFAACGHGKQEFTLVKSRSYQFAEYYDEFADIKQTDSDILNLIGKDKRITAKIIGETLKLDPYYVQARIDAMQEAGVLRSTTQTIGTDTIIERAINPEAIDTRAKPETIDVYIKYSYEPRPGLQPVIETTRPFCRRLLQLDRLYTRAEIESISQRVGYSVFDREGGFWGSKPHCRHEWKRHVVIKKRK
jgi:DNA-binding Lrp family transcriptional regulator